MSKNAAAVLADVDEDEVPRIKPRSKKAREIEQPSPSSPGSKRVKIMLEENENIPPTGQYFGINGRSYVLRPGIEAEVPVELINVLNDAVQDVPQVDPYTNQVTGYRKKLRFPYRVIAR